MKFETLSIVDKISRHLLTLFIVPILILTIVSTFYRFFILHDYLLSYEGDCDPVTSSCFVWCDQENENGECIDPFYYSIIEREAKEVFEKCGPDVTICDEAYECPGDGEYCEVFFCDPAEDGAESCDDINLKNL